MKEKINFDINKVKISNFVTDQRIYLKVNIKDKNKMRNTNPQKTQCLITSLFPNCEVTKKRIDNNVFNKFKGREIVIESNKWYFL